MGKPYASELARLESTYSWAIAQDVDGLSSACNSLMGYSLQAIGSGGSYSIAHFAAFLHQSFSGRLAKAITPLDAVFSNTGSETSSIILSAGGENPDILAAFRELVKRELRRLVVVCFSPNSQLADLARSYQYVDVLGFNHPAGKDGFVATNSLLGFAILLARAYSSAFKSSDNSLPDSLATLIHPAGTRVEFETSLRAELSPLWSRGNLLVLYGPSTQAAALDIESKFSEVALCPVQITDFRNFAHGRHHWLAKRGNDTGVLAFVAAEDRSLADRTLPLLPPDIPIARLDSSLHGFPAGIAALASVLYAVGFAGEAFGIDPGRPGVPLFGRKIYNLNVLRQAAKARVKRESVAIQRKRRIGRVESIDWGEAYGKFLGKIKATKFSGVVFDYDGTLCDRADRLTGIRASISTELERLLSNDVLVGIATGRGKSVKKDLRSNIPKKYWKAVVVGYYNGSDIGLLDDDMHPNSSDQICDELSTVGDALKDNQILARLAICTYRLRQITVETKDSLDRLTVWDVTQQIVARFMSAGVTLVRSTHSVDVLAPGVSKQQLVSEVRKQRKKDCAILCIGDAGRWPGNDFALLSEPFSVSVDEVSADLHTCWNLAPEGHRGVQACIDYMQALKPRASGLVFEVSKVGSEKE